MRRLVLLLVTACNGGSGDPPLVPKDYATTFSVTHPCQTSVDHDVRRVRILASPDAVRPYADRTPFPVGAILVKEEYGRTDDTCSGAIIEITAMQRLAAGEDPAMLDWRWERRTGGLERIDDDSCSGCHAQCPGGHEGTCAPP